MHSIAFAGCSYSIRVHSLTECKQKSNRISQTSPWGSYRYYPWDTMDVAATRRIAAGIANLLLILKFTTIRNRKFCAVANNSNNNNNNDSKTKVPKKTISKF